MDQHESESKEIFQIGEFLELLLISKDFKVIKTDVPTLKNLKKLKIEAKFF